MLCLMKMVFQRSNNSKSAKQYFGACFISNLGNSLQQEVDVKSLIKVQGGGRTVKPDEAGEREG